MAVKNRDDSGNASIVTGAGQRRGIGVTAYLGKILAASSLQTNLNYNDFPELTGGVSVGCRTADGDCYHSSFMSAINSGCTPFSLISSNHSLDLKSSAECVTTAGRTILDTMRCY